MNRFPHLHSAEVPRLELGGGRAAFLLYDLSQNFEIPGISKFVWYKKVHIFGALAI